MDFPAQSKHSAANRAKGGMNDGTSWKNTRKQLFISGSGWR
jgi:hypothetical protein